MSESEKLYNSYMNLNLILFEEKIKIDPFIYQKENSVRMQ